MSRLTKRIIQKYNPMLLKSIAEKPVIYFVVEKRKSPTSK